MEKGALERAGRAIEFLSRADGSDVGKCWGLLLFCPRPPLKLFKHLHKPMLHGNVFKIRMKLLLG